jgi:hypothetical protein
VQFWPLGPRIGFHSYSFSDERLFKTAKSTQPSPSAGVCQALHIFETPDSVGPGAATGVVGPGEMVVVGVTTPPTYR